MIKWLRSVKKKASTFFETYPYVRNLLIGLAVGLLLIGLAVATVATLGAAAPSLGVGVAWLTTIGGSIWAAAGIGVAFVSAVSFISLFIGELVRRVFSVTNSEDVSSDDDKNVPIRYLDSTTKKIMSDPVYVSATKETVDRKNVQKGQYVIPNHELKNEIADYLGSRSDRPCAQHYFSKIKQVPCVGWLYIGVIGARSSGKSCLIRRYTEGSFNESAWTHQWLELEKETTIPVVDALKNNGIVNIRIRESYRHRSVHFDYLQRSNGMGYPDAFIVVFDSTDSDSFWEAREDVELIMEKFPLKKVILVGSKYDNEESQPVSFSEANKFSQEHENVHGPFYISSKESTGVNEVFEHVVKEIFADKYDYKGLKIIKEEDELRSSPGCSIL